MSTLFKELNEKLAKAIAFLKEEKLAEQLQPDSVKISGDFKTGSKIELIGTDGELSPLPDGEYELDGKTFTVKDSIIDSIEGEEAPADEADETPGNMEDEPQDADTDKENPIADLSARVDELEKSVEAIAGIVSNIMDKVDSLNFSETVEKFNSDIEKVNETLVKLSKLPVKGSKTNNSNKVKDSRNDKIMSFISAVNSSRK